MSYFTRILQNVVIDTNNSSVTNLAVGNLYRFIGTPTSTLGVAGIQVSLWADQPANIYIQQSIGSITGVGTVAFNNGVTITGTNTKFLNDFVSGDTVILDSGGTPLSRTVDVVTSDTVMTVTAATTGGSLSGKAYTFYPWDLSDMLNYPAKSTIGTTIQAVPAYVRVKVTTNSATTTEFRLQTALCPIVEVVPRALDINGNLKITLQADRYGNPVDNSTFGELITSKRVRLVGAQFDGNTIDTNFWTAAASTGTVTQLQSNLTLTSGTANGHYASISSFRKARFIAGTGNRMRAHIRLADTGTTNVKRRWGIAQLSNWLFTVSGTPNVVAGNMYTNNSQTFQVCVSGTGVSTVSTYGSGAPGASGTLTQIVGTGGDLTFTSRAAQAVPTDGAYFELDGAVFSIVTCKGGFETRVLSGLFNGQYGYSYAPTTDNTVYDIFYRNSSVQFGIGQIPLHKVTASSAHWTNTMHFQVFADVTNSGASSAVAMYSRMMEIARVGELETEAKYFYQSGATAAPVVLKYGPGRVHSVILGLLAAAGTVKLYDGASNTVGTFVSLSWIKDSPSATIPIHTSFFTGLTLEQTGAGTGVTIIYE